MHGRFEAIIPAAGKGTRFLPVTSVVPKELLPIMNIPAIDFIARECEASAVSLIACVLHRQKQEIFEYLQTRTSKQPIELKSVYQTERLGLGHAVAQASDLIQGEFFGVLLPDDLIFGSEPLLKRLKAESDAQNASVIAVRAVPPQEVSAYGIIEIKKKLGEQQFLVKNIVEKPEIAYAPSRYAVIGRYILNRAIFDALKQIKPGKQGEYQLTDALQLLLQENYPIIALDVTDTHFDVGTPHGWLKAVNFYATASQAQLGFYAK